VHGPLVSDAPLGRLSGLRHDNWPRGGTRAARPGVRDGDARGLCGGESRSRYSLRESGCCASAWTRRRAGVEPAAEPAPWRRYSRSTSGENRRRLRSGLRCAPAGQAHGTVDVRRRDAGPDLAGALRVAAAPVGAGLVGGGHIDGQAPQQRIGHVVWQWGGQAGPQAGGAGHAGTLSVTTAGRVTARLSPGSGAFASRGGPDGDRTDRRSPLDRGQVVSTGPAQVSRAVWSTSSAMASSSSRAPGLILIVASARWSAAPIAASAASNASARVVAVTSTSKASRR
jgi:hypothetical protein